MGVKLGWVCLDGVCGWDVSERCGWGGLWQFECVRNGRKWILGKCGMKINGRVNTRLFELEHILNLLLVLNETLQAIHKFSSLNSGIGGNKA